MARPLNPLKWLGEEMFVIVAYDVHAKRCAKLMKYLKTWLLHSQRSLFVGFLTESKLRKMQAGMMKLINENYDSVIIYKANKADQITQWRTLGALIRGIEGVTADSSKIAVAKQMPATSEVLLREEHHKVERLAKAEKPTATHFKSKAQVNQERREAALAYKSNVGQKKRKAHKKRNSGGWWSEYDF